TITSIRSLFFECNKLEYLDLSSFHTTSALINMEWFVALDTNQGSTPNSLKYLNIENMTNANASMSNSFNRATNLLAITVGSNFRFKTSQFDTSHRWYRADNSDPASPISVSSMVSRTGTALAGTWIREGADLGFLEYTVVYDANGGTGNPEPVVKNLGESLTLPAADEVGIGNGDLNFAGWAKKKDAIFPDYRAGDSFTGTPGVTNTLYAVWVSADSYLIHFDANGGYSPTQWKRVNSLEDVVELPTPTHPSNREFLGWNTKEDGSGNMFVDSATGEELGGQPGETMELYAQWLDPEIYAKYKVEHYRQNPDGSYSLYETDNLYGERGSTVSPAEKEYEGYLIKDHDAEYTLPAAGQPDLVVKYYYDRLAYEVAYDGNGATSGQMLEKQSMLGSVQYDLWENQYHRKGYIFTGWNTEEDGSGQQFVDKQRVKNLTKVNGETVTLYAQWLGNEDGELTPTNGEIIVKCKAGQTIVIPDLPAGTTYTIEEIGNPAGWSQKGEIEGNGGTISANVTDQATATNTYKASGEAKINAHKILKGADIEEGQFTFELLDENGEVIDTKTNGEIDQNQQVDDEDGNLVDNPYYQTSLVEFDALEYTQEDIGKTYTYKIREKGEVQGVICDDLVADVSVHIEDAGKSILDVQVTYTNTTGNLEPIFENEMKKSQLKISKSIVDATDASENDEFTFTVNLKDSEGNAIEGEYDAEKGDDTITVKSGDTVTLKGGEEILIKGLPHGTVYEVTEEEITNWEMTDSSGTTGTLEPGETAEASFENTYHEPEKQPYTAEGEVTLTANKKVEGGNILEDDEFTFELIDENGEVIQTKTCDKVSTDGEAVTESTITFDKIEYDLDDLKYDEEAIEAYIQAQLDYYQQNYDEAKAAYEADHADDPDAKEYMDFSTWIRQNTGYTMSQLMIALDKQARESVSKENTFVYYVREVAGDDPDVDYDSSRYYYEVHAIDNGDGTISTDVKMYKPDEETDTEVDDITFINAKTTQIKVYKRWVDNDDQDEYRPTKEEFAEKIHLMAAVGDEDPEEVPDVQPTIREDADGNLTILYEGLAAYKDGKKITYTVKEDAIEHYTARDGQDEVEDGGTLMNVHAPDKVALEITKKMPKRIELPEEGENATVVFSVKGRDKNGKTIYENHVGMNFDKESGTYETVRLENIPANVTLTVEEVYGGSYEPKEGKFILKRTDLVEDDDGTMKWIVEFENEPGEPGYESGIVNKYKYTDGKVTYVDKKEADE
ncbi:MAG: FctA domain-containing protein, partial [Bacillota bacterium]|nr:FctA domain-containing protein [Bacillota bacterium]